MATILVGAHNQHIPLDLIQYQGIYPPGIGFVIHVKIEPNEIMKNRQVDQHRAI